jgi:hypothetical protein
LIDIQKRGIINRSQDEAKKRMMMMKEHKRQKKEERGRENRTNVYSWCVLNGFENMRLSQDGI